MNRTIGDRSESGTAIFTWVLLVALLAVAAFAAFLLTAQQSTRTELQEARAQGEKLQEDNQALEEKLAHIAKPAEDPNTLELVKLRAEVARLRKMEKEHQQTLTEVQQLKATVQELQQTTAETAALRNQNQQLQGVLQANAFAATCQAQLKQIAAAKAQWAAQNQKKPGDMPTDVDLFPKYLPQKPVCPAGGVYNLGPVPAKPTCTVPAHNF